MKQSEIILELGAEGGSLTIYGTPSEHGWVFSQKMLDQFLEGQGGEEESEINSQTTTSFSQAIEFLSKYQWQRLYPVVVHPEFGRAVFDAVLERYALKNDTDRRQLPRWKEICRISNE